MAGIKLNNQKDKTKNLYFSPRLQGQLAGILEYPLTVVEAHYDLQSDEKNEGTFWLALVAAALALLTFLSHIGIIRLPRKKNG
jgi:hypothetical protein